MSPQSKNTSATLIPCLRYRDVAAAIDWLCRAFGFECRRLYKDELFGITHAQLAFGNGMVMVAPVVDSEYGRQLRQPDEIGGASTQGIYVIVNSADALYAQAKAAGAQIAIELKDEDYGGRGFTCHDPEGHLWSFGTYDPWADEAAGTVAQA
ncbi:VOC family protein [Stutzerimonas frequens]|uniref:VOC family protein n=1 Tax=Stutzerimonas frequens TaxID=2968969 RepID=UPI00190DB5A4|nr:VOC family protein [Stutzerimonas frequens]MBK3870830.1 glyoxalase [Stutzerimonas frequens]MBK3909167.1 glyoxalase [Stutzerimonas frequens]MBK3929228.1 glyoxalase [Stutzerimonas frequens]